MQVQSFIMGHIQLQNTEGEECGICQITEKHRITMMKE